MPTIETSTRAVSFTKAQDAVKVFGGERVITGITIHHWGALGQDFDAVVGFFANDEDDDETSAHYVAQGGRVAQLVADADVAWHAGNRAANLSTLGFELRPEATDADYATAAWLIRRIREKYGDLPLYPHKHWKATSCPGNWDLERLDKLARTIEGVPPMSKMVNPTEGYVSSEWSKLRRNPATGVLTSHAGIDIAAPKGTLVVAAFAGTVTSVRTNSYNGDPTRGYGPKTGNHVLIKNSDGAYQYYGHLNTTGEYVGDHVEAGEVIGTVGNTGQVTGPHLHFECWSNSNINSNFDPRILFNKYGIKPGVGGTPIQPVADKKPVKKPATPAKLQHGYTRAEVNNIIRAMNRMGLKAGAEDGDYGSMLTAAVKAFQKQHGLVADGIYGRVTQAKWRLNRKIQEALQDQGYTRQTVDGWIGDQTTANVKDYQRRVGLVADGIAGAKTQKKLGI